MSAAVVMEGAGRARLLLVDDDDQLRGALARVLRAQYDVEQASSGEAAIASVRRAAPDVMLVDIHMQGMDGVQLLRRIRELDLDLPVILMSGAPSLDTAVRAVEYGAHKYIFKPLDIGDLRKSLESAVALRKLAAAKRESLRFLGKPDAMAADVAGLEATFNHAVRTLRVAYQPIVSWPRKRIIGYEALLRSTGSPLRDPDALLDAAERLHRIPELGREVRADAAKNAATLSSGMAIFVNLHPDDLRDEELYDPAAPLSKLASRVVLEITERASLDQVTDVRARIAKLRRMGYRLAVDDLGAGYAGLASFAQLEPEVVKIDMALVRDVHHSATKRKLIASMAATCRDLGVQVIAEGVELPAERDALVECGVELLQGFFFSRPAPPFPDVKW